MAFRLHKHQVPPLRRRLVAGVEDQVLIESADRERKAELGGAVGLRETAEARAGVIKLLQLLDIGDEQGAVAVEDVKDLELGPAVVLTTVPKVWSMVMASNLETEPATVGLRCLLRDEPERLPDAHVPHILSEQPSPCASAGAALAAAASSTNGIDHATQTGETKSNKKAGAIGAVTCEETSVSELYD